MFTKYFLPIALAAGTLALSAAGAQAMPLVKPSAAPLPIETVGWRCGPGWHINGWGRCVPNRRVYRAYGYYGPPRFHRWGHWHHRHWHRW